MNVGMIGIGLMGHGIAGNILKNNHQLSFLDHPGNQPVERLLALGAQAVSQISDVVENTDILLICVTGAPQVRSVMLEEGGALETLKDGQIVIDCSTSLPETSKEIAQALSANGVHFADAAMTRTPKEAEAGRLNMLVGADDVLFSKVKPLLECFAENIIHTGPVGSGHLMKLVHNYVSLAFSAVLVEALRYAESAHIEKDIFHEVLGKGSGAGVIFDRFKPFLDRQDTSAFHFSIANASKDLGYYYEALGPKKNKYVLADAVNRLYKDAATDGYSDKSVFEILEFMQKATSEI